jgi:leucyl aminopeptidase
MNIEVQSLKAINVSSDILVIGFFKEKAPPKGLAGEMDWILNSSLSSLVKSGKISGKVGEVVLMSSGRTKTPKIFWVGLGKREEFSPSVILKFAADLYERLEQVGAKEAYLDLWDIEGCRVDFFSALNAFLNGIFEDQKDPQRVPVIDLTFHARDKERVKEMNRTLKEINLKSILSFRAGHELSSQTK